MRVHMGLLPALSLTLLLVCPARGESTDEMAAAEAAYAAKEYARAIPLYQTVVDSGFAVKVRARAQWRLGSAYKESGNTVAARTTWLAVADRFPEQARYACDSLLQAGDLALAAEDFRGATDSYSRACATVYIEASDSREIAIRAMCALGRAHVRSAERTKSRVAEQMWESGVTPTCKVVWDAAAEDFTAGRKAYEDVVALFPESAVASEAAMHVVELKYEWAFYGRGGSYDDVVKAADAFLKKYPQERRQSAVVCLERTFALYTSGRYGEALAGCRAILDGYKDVAGPGLGTAQYLLARCYESKRDFDRAIKEFDKFLDEGKPSFGLADDRAAAELAIGSMLRIQRKWDAAAKALTRVRKDFPDTHWDRQAAQSLEGMASDRALERALLAKYGRTK